MVNINSIILLVGLLVFLGASLLNVLRARIRQQRPQTHVRADIIKNDPKYRETWKHWVGLKKFFQQHIIILDKKIMDQ